MEGKTKTLETIKLSRMGTSLANGTFGKLYRGNDLIAVTCERPWDGNKKKISCIPVGIYRATKFKSPSKNKQVGGWVYLLHNVPNRSMIEIHIGNTIEDSLGILPCRECLIESQL